MGLAQRELCLNDFPVVCQTTAMLPWLAIVTKPQHERSVHESLVQKGFDSFVPLYWVTRKWSDRLKRLQTPLFPQYVFCRCDGFIRHEVMKTPGVRWIVSLGSELTAIPEDEIERVRVLVASGSPLEPWPFLKVGQRVRVDEGPLAGLEGILESSGKSHRVVVTLEVLQRSVAVELDRHRISPL